MELGDLVSVGLRLLLYFVKARKDQNGIVQVLLMTSRVLSVGTALGDVARIRGKIDKLKAHRSSHMPFLRLP